MEFGFADQFVAGLLVLVICMIVLWPLNYLIGLPQWAVAALTFLVLLLAVPRFLFFVVLPVMVPLAIWSARRESKEREEREREEERKRQRKRRLQMTYYRAKRAGKAGEAWMVKAELDRLDKEEERRSAEFMESIKERLPP